ncbi:MAG: flagellar protein FlaG [Spirochaetota bacterium]
MSIEITGIFGGSTAQQPIPGNARSQGEPATVARTTARTVQSTSTAPNIDIELDALVEDLRVVTSALDRRLKFSINRELDQVVVKVIDRKTDKVIKELPPAEIQRLHVRLREAIGLLIDEEI